MRSFLAYGVALLGLLVSDVFGFGATRSGDFLTVDTSGGLVFTVRMTSGDITSLKFNGIEAQDSSKFTQISSGLGASCTNTQSGNLIKITCTTSTLTQYYVARNGDPSVHMATFTSAEPSVGELRFIARLKRSAVPNGPIVSNIVGGTAIEGSDVFTVNGQTRSKFYSSKQFIDNQVIGATGSGIGAFVIVSKTGYEGSSGGPFFRDIANQGGDQQEIYFYMACLNSGHTQTEANRMGLHGPYALRFTTGATPSSDLDISFWESLTGISGFVPVSGRGFVNGKAIGVDPAFNSQIAVGWSNSNAQYWARADAGTQNFGSPAMKPGTYTMTVYKGELAVGSQSVTVTAGRTLSSNIHATNDPTPANAIFRLGDFDGTPRGFLNADMIETMHPSDKRMHEWLRSISISQGSGFVPMAVFKDIGPFTLTFPLASGQAGQRTLIIATTLAFAGARPQVQVNNFSSAIPAIPSQPDSRGVTRGTWRGNNILYTFTIPDGTLHTGSSPNTLIINAVSGSSGSQFLSPNFVIDAIALF